MQEPILAPWDRSYFEDQAMTMFDLYWSGEVKINKYGTEELAVVDAYGEKGTLFVEYKKCGYFPYLCGKKDYTDRISLIADCIWIVTSDNKVLFQQRSGNVAIGQGLLSASAEGNVEARHKSSRRKLSPAHAAVTEAKEEVGIEVDIRKVQFVGAALDNMLSFNHLLTYNAIVGHSETDIREIRKKDGVDKEGEVEKIFYPRLDDLHEFVANYFNNLTPSGIFGSILLGVTQYSERWLEDLGKKVAELRHA